MKTTHNISATETLAGWIIWIWFLVSSVGFLYTIFHIGNYIFNNVGYLVFWAIFINAFLAMVVGFNYALEMAKKENGE
jgi:hypothetical protein